MRWIITVNSLDENLIVIKEFCKTLFIHSLMILLQLQNYKDFHLFYYTLERKFLDHYYLTIKKHYIIYNLLIIFH